MKIKRFLGLNNVTDPLRMPAGWLSRADNVNITDTGAVVKRAGFEPVLQAPATVRSAFANKAMDRLYLHAGDEVLRVMPDMSPRTLAAGVGAAPLRWDEFNKQALFVGPEAAGIITRDNELLPLRWDMPMPPLLRAVPGVMPAGTYRVCWAWVMPDGRETGVGEAAHIDLAEGEGIEIAGLPQVAGWRVRLYLCPAGSTVFQHLLDTQGPGAT
ncbi:MAG: hypothetical protein IIA03_08785, partial [Proteobacteria bacterium]|nr:hypothetical protein [Pseudomonadota bacterium]